MGLSYHLSTVYDVGPSLFEDGLIPALLDGVVGEFKPVHVVDHSSIGVETIAPCVVHSSRIPWAMLPALRAFSGAILPGMSAGRVFNSDQLLTSQKVNISTFYDSCQDRPGFASIAFNEINMKLRRRVSQGWGIGPLDTSTFRVPEPEHELHSWPYPSRVDFMCEGTSINLSYSTSRRFLCSLVGSTRVILFNSSDMASLSFDSTQTSDIRFEHPKAILFNPEFQELQSAYTINLDVGDALYIPPSWPIFVTSRTDTALLWFEKM